MEYKCAKQTPRYRFRRRTECKPYSMLHRDSDAAQYTARIKQGAGQDEKLPDIPFPARYLKQGSTSSAVRNPGFPFSLAKRPGVVKRRL